MNNDDELWKMIREGAPLPEAPAWFSARTVARMRAQTSLKRTHWLSPSWVWLGGTLILMGLLVVTLEINRQIVHDRQVTYAALDILAGKNQTQDQDEAWLTYF